jgi:glycosyltransferase involved in cell wall biosynthesis
VKYLFVHQNFPGQYLHIVRHLVKDRRNDVVFVSEPNQNHIAGVRKIPNPKPESAAAGTHVAARDLDEAARRAEVVARIGTNLKGLGFSPDIIVGHHGWGELLNLPEVWPGVPILGYLEFFYRTDGADVGFDPEFPIPPSDFPRIRAKNAVNLIALHMPGRGQTPTEWQRSTYPSWAHEGISLLREGANLEMCKPDAGARRRSLRVGDVVVSPKDKLVTYVARDLEPYRGFHVMMRALPHLLTARRDIRVVMIGGDGISYGAPPANGTWRELMIAELGNRIDLSRVVFPGKVDYATYLGLLKRSDAHVYLTYPFVASWSLREALAAGCVVIGSDTPPVREFITDGLNGLLVSFFEPQRLAERVLETLEDRGLAARLRRGARAYAERNLAMGDYLDAFGGLVGELVGGLAHVAEAASERRRAGAGR